MAYSRLGRVNYPNDVSFRSNGFMYLNLALIKRMGLSHDGGGYGSILVNEDTGRVRVEFVRYMRDMSHHASTYRTITVLPNGWMISAKHLFKMYDQKLRKLRSRATVGEGWVEFSLDFVRVNRDLARLKLVK